MTAQDGTISRFRKRRGRILARRIRDLAAKLGRPVTILDVGGRRDYWDNIGFDGIASIALVNIEQGDLGRRSSRDDLFSDRLGDARRLGDVPDLSFDFYHSNSVIEHVGGWGDMAAMAAEARRVAPHGWLQTPAWGFPIEPHFRLPFMHWLATPARASLLRLSRAYRHQSHHDRRLHAERINLLSKGEVALLFPGASLMVERFVLPKSYVVTW